ncbi:hypothetical protein N7535_001706 [Penicillium sp. DV-2018c]|nr:hypothetical protein N7535_001706 [Penicillium sp. DV-2018c]
MSPPTAIGPKARFDLGQDEASSNSSESDLEIGQHQRGRRGAGTNVTGSGNNVDMNLPNTDVTGSGNNVAMNLSDTDVTGSGNDVDTNLPNADASNLDTNVTGSGNNVDMNLPNTDVSHLDTNVTDSGNNVDVNLPNTDVSNLDTNVIGSGNSVDMNLSDTNVTGSGNSVDMSLPKTDVSYLDTNVTGCGDDVDMNLPDTNVSRPNITARELELQRLEALRVELANALGVVPAARYETAYEALNDWPAESSSPIGEPGPSVPNSGHYRAIQRSNSDISSLDLGSSIETADLVQPLRLRNTSLVGLFRNVRLDPSTQPRFVAGPDNDSNGESEHQLRTEDLESVAITSTSDLVVNHFHLSQRQRRSDETHLNLPTNLELRQLRQSLAPEHDGHGRMRPSLSRASSTGFFPDEADRRVYSLSVPHSPRSTTPATEDALFRSMSSFGGMDPAFFAMHARDRARQRAERARENSQDST